jgi:hypothetical protein
MRQFTTLVAVLFMAAAPASAQKSKTDKTADFLGTWTHNSASGKVTLELKEHTLRCTISEPDCVTVRVDAEYMISHDGFLVGMLRAKKNKGERAEDEASRRAFFCQVKKDGDALVVTGLQIKDRQEDIAKIVEGSYSKKGSAAAPAAYSSDPNRRMIELINQSEDLRQVQMEWERFWTEARPEKKK